jgi:phosphate transport system permease protein
MTSSIPATQTNTLRRTVSPKRRVQNAVATGLIGLMTIIVLMPLFAITYEILRQGIGNINLALFFESPKSVIDTSGGGGVAHAIVGSLMMIAIGLVIGLAVGIGAGVFLAEFSEHKLVPVVRLFADVLTGIPAIVVGLVVFQALINSRLIEYSALAGGIALGFIMIPIIVRSTEEVLKLVPLSIREAGLALGLPRWLVTVQIVLPAARAGIVTGVILAVSRVGGEAAPLLLTALGNNFFSLDPMKAMSALPLAVYKYAFSPFEHLIRQAWAASFVLVLLVFVSSLIARYAIRQK